MLFSVALWLLAATPVVFSSTVPEIPKLQPEAFPYYHKPTVGALIIQLKKDESLGKRFGNQATSHARFHKRATLGRLDYKVRTEFTNPSLFYGLSIQLNQNKTVDEIQTIFDTIPEVLAFYPIRKVRKPVTQGQGNLTSVDWKTYPFSGGWTPTDTSPNLPHIKGTGDIASTLKMADVDKLHALGIKGKGMRIAFIDSGIDYTHPSLGGGFGPGYKVAGGYAFVNDEWNGGTDPIENANPLATCYEGGHGTHVAGIVGMQDPKNIGFGLTGVAPEASLYMYRVFSCAYDYTDDDYIMNAMRKAAEDGADVISMSLGAMDYFEGDSPYTELVKSITAQGIAIVAANGNDGQYGIYAESTPGNVDGAIAVGSVTNAEFPIIYTGQDSQGGFFQYASIWPLNVPKGLKVYYHGSECTYSSWLNTGNAVAGDNTTIVIATTSANCALGTQMSGASAVGISYLLTYSIGTDPFSQDIETQIPFAVTTIVVTPSTGAKLFKNFQADSKYQLKFNSPVATSTKLVTGNQMSNFSSFGPSWDTVAVKPQLSAPGGKILSTWPLGPAGGYAIISGTSMATPFVAGCYALVKSRYPKLSVSEITNLLQVTSTPLSYVYDKSILSTVAHQGAGMINPFKATIYSSTISPSQLSLGDLDDFGKKKHTVTIHNRSPLPQVYSIKHKGAGYAEVFPYPDLLEPNYYNSFGQPQYGIYGSASFSQSLITVPGGQSRDFQVTISAPKLSQAQILKTPLFSGFIQVTSLLESYSIPYLGEPYSRQNTPAIDLANTTIYDAPGNAYSFSRPVTFNFPGLWNDNPDWTVKFNTGFQEYNLTLWEFPNVLVNFLTGISQFQVNVLPANTPFKATHSGGNPGPGYQYLNANHTPHDVWLGVPSYGWLPANSQNNNAGPRQTTYNMYPFETTVTFYWGAVYFDTIKDDGEVFEYLPPGDYRILVSLLKPGSDAAIVSEWETWLGPVVRLQGHW